MNTLALIFPGQGSQDIGMGNDFYKNMPEATELFERADKILSYQLTKIMFEGPEKLLHQTKYAQAAMVLASTVMYHCFKSKLQKHQLLFKEVYCGHSLGEFSAYYAAGVWSFEDLLRIVQKRGELMDPSHCKNIGKMLAIVGLNDQEVHEVCVKASAHGQIFIANFNCLNQRVLSGEASAIEKAAEYAKSKKARLTKVLNVQGAFHSPLMTSSASDFEQYINQCTFRTTDKTIISSATADKVDTKDLKHTLKNHMLSPVLWEQSVLKMISMGIRVFIEIGHGKVLQGLVKKIDKDIDVLGISDCESLDKTIHKLLELYP